VRRREAPQPRQAVARQDLEADAGHRGLPVVGTSTMSFVSGTKGDIGEVARAGIIWRAVPARDRVMALP
jgi:hypothetical protein